MECRAESQLEAQEFEIGVGEPATVKDQIASLRDELRRYYATKRDIEKAKNWLITVIIGGILALVTIGLSIAVLVVRVFFDNGSSPPG